MTTTKTTATPIRSANNAFIGHCLRIDEALAALNTLRADHFGADAETSRNWGEVGSVEEIANRLEAIIAFASGK